MKVKDLKWEYNKIYKSYDASFKFFRIIKYKLIKPMCCDMECTNCTQHGLVFFRDYWDCPKCGVRRLK
jgi:hypothetical protein